MQEEIHNSTFDYKQKNSDKGNYDRSSGINSKFDLK